MKKVFLIHGFEGSPNGGWRPWLMAELEKMDVYACALAMPSPENPQCKAWVEEISRHVEQSRHDDIYLVGHSLGVPAILRFLEEASENTKIQGIVLVAGPSEKNENKKIENFFTTDFNFEHINSKFSHASIIHGDNDPLVPISNGQFLSAQLHAPLTLIPNGGHLNGSSGCTSLPPCLEALSQMFLMV